MKIIVFALLALSAYASDAAPDPCGLDDCCDDHHAILLGSRARDFRVPPTSSAGPIGEYVSTCPMIIQVLGEMASMYPDIIVANKECETENVYLTCPVTCGAIDPRYYCGGEGPLPEESSFRYDEESEDEAAECVDDDEGAINLAASQGITLAGCVDIPNDNGCSRIPPSMNPCPKTCGLCGVDRSTGDFAEASESGECGDNDEAAITMAAGQGATIASCAELAAQCAMIPAAVNPCKETCGLCADSADIVVEVVVKIVEVTPETAAPTTEAPTEPATDAPTEAPVAVEETSEGEDTSAASIPLMTMLVALFL